MVINISVVGAGYVGLSTALGFVKLGHRSVCVDMDTAKIEKISQGIPPFDESEIADALKDAIEKGLIAATGDLDEAVKDSEVTFICVGTPSLPDGSINLSYIKNASSSIGHAIREKNAYHMVCVKSTVLPGTTEDVTKILESASGKKAGIDFGICMNPEFLREGSALHDFLNPDRIIIGGIDKKSGDLLEELYSGISAPVMRTSPATAEMIKYASNAFLATKVTFINEVGNLCKKLGIDIYEVARGMGYDRRISPYFLNAGCGFGGSCFPKDVSALVSLFSRENEKTNILEAVLESNKSQKNRIVEILKTKINPSGKKIAVLGLAFKEDSDDVRDSVAIDIIMHLKDLKAVIYAYDPVANGNMKKIFPDVTYVNTKAEALENAEACLILTGWKEFSELADADFSVMKSKIIIEGRRVLDRTQVSSFEGVCW